MVRIGTSGGLQPFTPVGSFVAAEKSIGFDGVLYFYKDNKKIRDLQLENCFLKAIDWKIQNIHPYIVSADRSLTEQICKDDIIRGITIAANGFYGPQGRELRLRLFDNELNKKIQSFEYEGHFITNYEMESSALAGLAAMMGHRAMTVCCVIAGRIDKNMNTDYKNSLPVLIEKVLDRI
jgi:uridine phosphorylase